MMRPDLKVKIDANKNIVHSSPNGKYDKTCKMKFDRTFAESGLDCNKKSKNPGEEQIALGLDAVNDHYGKDNLDYLEPSTNGHNADYENFKTEISEFRNSDLKEIKNTASFQPEIEVQTDHEAKGRTTLKESVDIKRCENGQVHFSEEEIETHCLNEGTKYKDNAIRDMGVNGLEVFDEAEDSHR